jgi:hypothetical protein
MFVSALQVTSAYSAAKDVFFSEISQVLSRGIRHVIVPPSASWHHHVSRLWLGADFSEMLSMHEALPT